MRDGAAPQRSPAADATKPAGAASDVVFLLDVDNTLLDNDHVVADLRQHLLRQFGRASADRYWAIFEQLRVEIGYADYLGALQRYRAHELSDAMNDPGLLQMSMFLIDYPFAERLYAGALVCHRASAARADRWRSCRTAMSCSSRARCSARACGTRSMAAS